MVCNIIITPSHFSGAFNGEADPILSYRLEYPNFSARPAMASTQVVNQFYNERTLAFLHYLTHTFAAEALQSYLSSIENNYPVIPYEAQTTYSVTYNHLCIVSLYEDRYLFTGGAHGTTTRYGQTWNLATGKRLELKDFFPNHTAEQWENALISAVVSQASKNPSYYFPELEENVRKNFNSENFFLSPEGLHIFYQQYDIAPYSSGIQVFTIPFS